MLGDANGTGAREVVRSLIREIRLGPEEGRLRIEVRRELSSILALTSGAENAQREYRLTAITGGGRRGAVEVHGNGTGDGGWRLIAQQVKMVAGTGFEPVTFRL